MKLARISTLSHPITSYVSCLYSRLFVLVTTLYILWNILEYFSYSHSFFVSSESSRSKNSAATSEKWPQNHVFCWITRWPLNQIIQQKTWFRGHSTVFLWSTPQCQNQWSEQQQLLFWSQTAAWNRWNGWNIMIFYHFFRMCTGPFFQTPSIFSGIF